MLGLPSWAPDMYCAQNLCIHAHCQANKCLGIYANHKCVLYCCQDGLSQSFVYDFKIYLAPWLFSPVWHKWILQVGLKLSIKNLSECAEGSIVERSEHGTEFDISLLASRLTSVPEGSWREPSSRTSKEDYWATLSKNFAYWWTADCLEVVVASRATCNCKSSDRTSLQQELTACTRQH